MSYNLSITTECAEPFLGPTLGQSCPGSQFLMFMSLVDTFVRAKQDISFLCERVKPIDPPEYFYDFIVVGGEYVLYWKRQKKSYYDEVYLALPLTKVDKKC